MSELFYSTNFLVLLKNLLFYLSLGVLDPEESTQEVPDLDLSADLLTQSSEEYTLVPEYADLGIIYGLGIEKVGSFWNSTDNCLQIIMHLGR